MICAWGQSAYQHDGPAISSNEAMRKHAHIMSNILCLQGPGKERLRANRIRFDVNVNMRFTIHVIRVKRACQSSESDGIFSMNGDGSGVKHQAERK